MATEKKIVFSRVDHDTYTSIQDLANERFNGTISEVVREGSKLYVDLRNLLGPRFDLEIHELRQRELKRLQTAETVPA